MDKYKTQSNRFSIQWFKILHAPCLWRLRGFHRCWLMFSAMLSMMKGRLFHTFIGRRQGFATAAVAVSFCALLFTTSVQAAQVTLAWDSNNPAPDGYRVYQRLDGKSYDYSSRAWPRAGDDATQTKCTITGLSDDTTYHFVVRAYKGKVESGDSNEATYKSASPVATPYTITATAGAHGSISPGTVTVKSGASKTFTIVPASNYIVADVKVDGASIGAKSAYTFTAVNRNHTINASFAPVSNTTPPPVSTTYTIKVASGADGRISPSTTTVSAGGSQTFTITPDLDCQIADVIVDGRSMGAVTSYTFKNVSANHTVSATFKSNAASQDVKIWMEAEDGDIVTPMEIAGDADASAGGYIWAPQGAGNLYNSSKDGGQAEYRFDVPTDGDYIIWGRVMATDSGTDSFYVSVDGSEMTWHTKLSDNGNWTWDVVSLRNVNGERNASNPLVYHLGAGSHTITIKQREDGTRLDNILLTRNLSTIAADLQ
jgi:hypothetical protein